MSKKIGITELMHEKNLMPNQRRKPKMYVKNFRKNGEENRSVTISLRMTPEEAAQLDAARGVYQRGTYCREIVLNHSVRQPQTAVIPEINARAYTELARSAANLNQLCFMLRQEGASDVLLKQIAGELKAFRLALIGAKLEGEKL